MRHTEFALSRPVTIVMIFVALGLIGTISALRLPLEKFPDIEFPGIFVNIPYEGSSPEEVERLITRPVEEVLATLPGLKEMQSASREDRAEIFVRFDWDRDAAAAGIDARAKIEAIRNQLPADLRRVNVFTGSLGDQPIMVLRISSERDLSDAYDMLDRLLKRRIERVEGVSRVELQGVEQREIRILLDADRVAAHRLDLNALREQLETSNFSVSAGQVTAQGLRFNVRPRGEFSSVDDIRNLLINERGLVLSDVAEVELRSPERTYGRRLDGTYAVGVSVFKSTGANMVEVADRVKAEVESVGELPEMRGINIFDLDNQADGVRKSLRDLLQSGLIGAVLAIVVLYLFLRQLSTTLIVTLSVPFSLLITLAVLYFSGLTLNMLTMMGLMLAIGMLVDNAVVITESIFRYRQMQPAQPRGATIAGVREVGLAVMAGTLTTVAVFFPVIFGEKTDIFVFLTHVAVTITVAVLSSLLIAQTLIPMLASRVRPPPPPKPGALMSRLIERYVGVLAWTLRRRGWTALIIGLILVTGFAIPPRFINFDAFPQEAGRRLFMPYHVDDIYPLERVEQAVERVESYLLANRDAFDIRSVYSYYDQGRAETTILLTDEDEATLSTTEAIEKITEGLPDIVIGEPSFNFGQQGGGEGFSLQISGESTDVLAGLSYEARRRLYTLDGFDSLTSDLTAGEREIRVAIDQERATRLGLTAAQVATAIQVALRGDQLKEFRGVDGEIRVRLAYRESDKQSLEDLAGLPLYTPEGERVTLGTVASFEQTRGPRTIRRVDRQTAVTIEGTLAPGASLEELRPDVRRLMSSIDWPPGYSWTFGRSFQRNDETQAMMLQSIVLGIALIFIVMAALFESVIYPVSIIVSILFSVVGVFWFFMLTGTTFSFMASIGIMILIGVVVNNGIVLVDHINNLRREGLPRNQAILEGGRHRLRPILMTVATTILGLTPLAIGTTQVGGDGPPYYPMARAIIGGLAFSTLVSLVVVPYLYTLLDDLANWSRKLLRLSRRQVAGT